MLLNFFSLKSVFKKFRFCDKLVRVVYLSMEIKLCFLNFVFCYFKMDYMYVRIFLVFDKIRF